jgi:DNA-directed RNA polymerase subunit M/transcription elongation factor TFIIS
MAVYDLPSGVIQLQSTSGHQIKPLKRQYAILSLALQDSERVLQLSEALTTTISPFNLRWLANQPEFKDPKRIRHAVHVEKLVFEKHRHSCFDYTNDITQLLHIMVHKPQLQCIDPEELMQLSLHQLVSGTSLQKVRDQIDGHEAKFKLMLSEKFEELEQETKENDQLVTCKKCNSTNVILAMRQVRSADEGMAAFISCLNCRSCFRMD